MKTAAKFLVLSSAGLLLAASAAHAAPWSSGNADWNVNLYATADPANYYGAWSGHTYFPSPDDWRKVPIYQLITDRWNDGRPENNELDYGGYDLTSVGTRHGGDFLGVSNKLEYIRSLGYKGIWISPVFQNRDNSYHGYGQIDFTLLDKRFGTVADFRGMVSKAHELGLYVIVDIVVNHISDLYYFEGYPSSSAPFHMHSGEYNLIERNPGETYVDFPVVNTKYETGQYCDVYGDDGYVRTDSGAGSFWDSDLHHNGDLGDYGDPWQNHLGKIYGTLDDLRTTHPRVQGKITAMTKALIASCDVDGIRMDTPMQVPRYFFENWCTAVKAYAATLGKNDFFIFGEFYCSRERAVTMVGRGRTPAQYGDPYSFINSTYTMDGGINYRIYFDFFQPAVKDQTSGNLRNALTGFQTDMNNRFDFYDPVWSEVRYTHLNFYNNHDQWRMIHNPGGYAEGVKKTDLGSAILAFFPGIPLFYYGDEQGFCTSGTALDGWSREDFMTSLAWNNVSALVSPNPAIKDNFNMCHPQYLYVQKCMNVRDKYPALQTTDTVYERWAQDGYGANGIFAFSRAWGAAANWALVAFNTWDAALEAGGSIGSFYTGWNSGDVIVNALNPTETYTLTTDGKLASLWVNPFETKVFVRQDNLQALNPVVTNVYPAHDERVGAGAYTIKVQFSEAMDGDSVTNNFRYDGERVAASALTWNGTTRELSYDATIAEGIHTIEVLTNALSSAGNGLYGAKFRSRFRCGIDQNILANAAATTDATLLNDGDASTASREVTLYHKATGAEKLRVKNADGVWGDWEAYAATTALTLPEGDGVKSIQVQYWADGSGAYFVSDTITLGQGGCTVTLVQQTDNYNASYDNGGGAYNPDGAQMGMWANSSGAKQTVRWRNFRTDGGSGGNNRSLQVGDIFKITVNATRSLYGQIGLSLNASGTQGGSWDNRTSGSRLYMNTDAGGAWYVNRSGGNTTFGSGCTPLQGTYKDYVFTVRITSETTADAYLTVDSTDYRAYNLTMNGSAGANINAYSAYLADDWDGANNRNVYLKQTTSVENSRRVELGYWLASGNYNPGKVTDGLDACDGTTASPNAVYIGGDSGTSVTLDDANTFTGAATVDATATAKAQNANAFGTVAGGVTVTSGGRIQLSGGISVGAEDLSLDGTGISGSGALQNVSDNNAWGGDVAVAGSTKIAADSGSLTLGGTVDMGGANDRTLAIAGSGGVTINGDIVNAAGGLDNLAKSGSGTLTLGAIAADPELMFNHSGGTISISTAGAIGGPTGYNYQDKFNFLDNATLALSSGTVTLGRYVSDGDRVGFVIAAGKTATFDVAIGATLAIDGKITQTAAGGALTKANSGTLVLNQANEYTGATTVGAGMLVVNGSIGGSSVSVSGGATLAGTGTVGPIASLAGTISPGNSVGTLSVSGNAALGGGTYDCEIDSTSPTDCDLIEASGAVGAASALTVNLPETPPTGFDPNQPYYWVIASGDSVSVANMSIGTAWDIPENAHLALEQWGDEIVVTYTTPTSVVLYNFIVGAENGRVVVRWRTASESQTVGFWLERKDGATWVRVNDQIVYAQGEGGLGAAYALVDPGTVPGGTYVYRLIEEENDGDRQIHGPFVRTASELGFKDNQPIAWTGEGFLLRWLSRPDEWYRILRSTNLLEGIEGFRPIATGIPATPPENEYLDKDTGSIGLYLIQVEDP